MEFSGDSYSWGVGVAVPAPTPKPSEGSSSILQRAGCISGRGSSSGLKQRGWLLRWQDREGDCVPVCRNREGACFPASG